MDNKYLTFVTFYKEFATNGTARFKVVNPNPSFYNSFTEEDFYGNLYVHVNTESALQSKILESINGKLIVLCGPSGCGKSTVSRKTKNDLERNNKYKTIFYDARLDNSSKINDDNENIELTEKYIREIILDELWRDIPNSIDNKINLERIKLYYYILSCDKTESEHRKSQNYRVFTRLIDKCASLYLKNKNSSGSFNEWFESELKLNSKELEDIKMQVDELIDVSHLVEFSINYLKKYESLAIWIDNIDSFTNDQQSQIISILHSIQINFLEYCKIVISVREENIYRIGKYTDSVNEPFPTLISFSDPIKRLDYSEGHSAINVPVMESEQLNELVSKRLNFFHKKTQQYNNELTIKLNKLPNIQDSTDLYRIKQDKINVLEINDQRTQLRSLLQKASEYYLGESNFNKIKIFSSRITQMFKDEKVIYLANNSLKHYLQMHSSFLQHSINKFGEYLDRPENLSDTELTTEFLSWIHKVQEPFNVNTFNIISELSKNKLEHTIETSCFIPYLILTRIWNRNIELIEQSTSNNYAFISEIANDFENDFNISINKFKFYLYTLYTYPNARGNFIAFRTKKVVENPEDIELNTTVRITYRGRATIGSIINSYGYLRECVLSLGHKDSDVNIDERLMRQLEYIADAHINSLKLIKNKINKPEWYLVYLNKYGIPLDPRYVRNSSIGENILNVKYNRSLYMTSVFDSLLRYFKWGGKIRDELIRIQQQFEKKLNQIK